MNFYKKLLIGLVLNINLALAGGWVVGGGELIGDAANPWFMKNTTMVTYCLMLDEANFGLSRQQSLHIIQKGFEFWNRQLKSQQQDSSFPLGRQSFVEVSCENQPDIKFQFGVLNLEQLDQLKDVERKIGFTVRTSYDRVNMKAQGFVYLSPEMGPLKIQNPRVVEKPWSRSQGLLAQLVLLHEIGHIFGLPHDPTMPLMEESYVDSIVSNEEFIKSMDPSFIEKQMDGYYMFEIAKAQSISDIGICVSNSVGPIVVTPNPPPNPNSRYKKYQQSKLFKNFIKANANGGSLWKRFFNLNEDPSCISYSSGFEKEKYFVGIEFSSRPNQVLRQIKIFEQVPYSAQVRADLLFKIYLPKEQAVIKENYMNSSGYIYAGRREKSVTFKTNWIDKGVNHPMIVTLYPNNSFVITTEFEGIVYFDLINGY